MKRLPYGINDYKELITEDYYYVDKTNYLEVLEGISNKKIAYFRPRRFGKTMFTSMMYYYYDIKSKDMFEDLFKDTYIYTAPTDLRNSYYVLKLDFSGMSNINTTDTNMIESKFKDKVIEGIEKFLDYYDVNLELDYTKSSATIMSTFLYKSKLDRKIYIIIDEYDNFTNAILQDNTDIFKSILGKNGFIKDFYARIKENCGTIIDRVFITGVCSVSLDSMTSGFNIATNITNYSIFNAMTALTHEEAKKVIEEVDESKKEEIFNVMEESYDGYKFSYDAEEKVFNPTLVMYYLDYYNKFNKPTKNLMDSNILSNYKQIESIIKLNYNNNYNDVLLEVMNNELISSKLKENFELDEDFLRDDIVSMLYYFGYLTIDSYSNDKYNFVFPNKIITDVFNNYFKNILTDNDITIDHTRTLEVIEDMAKTGTIDKLNLLVEDTLKEFSNRIFIGINEKTIQCIYVMLLKNNNIFKVFDEFEVKEGYSDLILISDSKITNYDFIIEFKYIKPDKYSEEEVNRRLKEAKNQILSYDSDDRIKFKNKELKKYIVIYSGKESKIYEV